MEFLNKIKYVFWRKPKLHIISDSHGEAFYNIKFKSLSFKPSFCIVQGATASGLANPNSKTRALPQFLDYINKKVKKRDYLLVELGEVDCGFTIWLIAKNKKISISEQLDFTLRNYFNFLKQISSSSAKLIVVMSAIPPTIKDGAYKGDVANLRREVRASQKERTELTVEFNRRLKEYCNNNQLFFIDLDKNLIDNKTGLVKSEYRNQDEKDHHLNPLKLALLLEEKLKLIDEKNH